MAAYALPAMVIWAALGIAATSARLPGVALAATVAYGGLYAASEIAGRRRLPPPGRSWQVPQSMLIGAPVRRRVLVWGALLGPGFATRNPYAGFWLLPLVIAAMPGLRAGLAVGAAIGLAHGAARAAALLRDIRERQPAAARVATDSATDPRPPAPDARAPAPEPRPASDARAPAPEPRPASDARAPAPEPRPASDARAPAPEPRPASDARAPAPSAPATHLDALLKALYWRRLDAILMAASAATAAAALAPWV